MNNLNGLMSIYQNLRTNPIGVLAQRFNIPTGIDASSPQNIIQHLLNTGQVTQAQVNNAMAMRDNPVIKNLFNVKK